MVEGSLRLRNVRHQGDEQGADRHDCDNPLKVRSMKLAFR
jgi:hypothetical protein